MLTPGVSALLFSPIRTSLVTHVQYRLKNEYHCATRYLRAVHIRIAIHAALNFHAAVYVMNCVEQRHSKCSSFFLKALIDVYLRDHLYLKHF